MDFLASIFGNVIRAIYYLCQDNYALSIIIFTIITKIILYPIYLKQMKSTEAIKKVKPKYDEIMKKYKTDKVKQSEEITKLYAQHKINPLSGCLPILIQLPLILAMFAIVRQPLTYIVQTPKEEIRVYAQEILQKEEVSDQEMSNLEIEIANKSKLINMNFIGLNLGDIPSNVFSKDENKKSAPVSLIIPILAVLLSLYQIKQMQKSSQMTDEQKQMQKSMNMMIPLMSGIVSYTMPLALGIYWLFGSIMQIAQQYLTNRLLNKNNDDKENNTLFLKDGGKNEKNK